MPDETSDDDAETLTRVKRALDELADEPIDLDQPTAALRDDIETTVGPAPDTALGRTLPDYARAVMFTLLGVSVTLFVLILLLYTGTITPLLVNTPHLAETDAGGGEQVAFNQTAIETELREELNERRQAAGLAPLAANQTLARVAQNHSRAMAAVGTRTPRAPTEAPLTTRLDRAGYTCTVRVNGSHNAHGAQLLAVTYYDRAINTDDGVQQYTTPEQFAEAVVNEWLESSANRRVLLAPYRADTGLGINMTAGQKVYVTQVVC